MMLRDVTAHLGHLRPQHVTHVAALGLLNLWRDRYAQGTLYNMRRNFQRFLDALQHTGAPPIALPKVKPGKPRRVVATIEETDKLLRSAEPHLRFFLLLALQLGLRFHEAATLAPKHWNADKHEITFTKKGGEQHTLPTTPEIEALIAIAPDEGPAVPYVQALRGPGGKTEHALRQQYESLRKRLGINPNLNPHDLRRTLLVSAYELTHDLRATQQIAGHASMATTAEYLQHVDSGKLRALIHQLRMPTEVKQ
jgi:integrase